MSTYFDPLIIVFFVLLLVIPIFTVGVGIAFIIYFIHEDDKKRAWLPKLIVLLAFALGSCSILLLPVDLLNSTFGGLGLGAVMDLILGVMWQVFYIVVAVMVLIIMPFTIFFYEAEDPEKGILHQAFWGALFTAVVVVVVTIIATPTYILLGKVTVPYTMHFVDTQFSTSYAKASTMMLADACTECLTLGTSIEFHSSLAVFMAGLIALIGWILFACVGGCGLTALPIVCIKACVCRPKRIRSDEFVEMKMNVMRKAEKLIELGMKIEEARDNGKVGRKDIRLFNEFKQAVYQIESDWKSLEKQFYLAGGSVIIPFLQGIAGFICAIITFLLLAHTVFYMIVPKDVDAFNIGVLSIVFRYCDYISLNVPLVGAILYCIFGMYMLLAVIAGSRYVLSRIPFFSVHPLKPHDTLMNSMLFNLGIFLLSSVAITHFSCEVFDGYVRTSSLSIMFTVIIRNLYGIGYFFRYVHYAYLGFSIIGAAFAVVLFREKSVNEKTVDDLMKRLG